MHLRLLQRYKVKIPRLVESLVITGGSFMVSREDVRVLLSVMDPGGVAVRKRHRLNRRVYLSKV